MKIGTIITNPCEMNKQVTLKSKAITTGTGSFQTEIYSTIAVVWAKWVGVHGSEAWSASMINAQRAATVMIRYRDDVDETCVVVLGSDIYEITSMDDIHQRHEYLELKVKKVVTG